MTPEARSPFYPWRWPQRPRGEARRDRPGRRPRLRAPGQAGFEGPPGRARSLGDVRLDREKAAREGRRPTSARLADLQERLYAERKRRVLVVLQGIDAAGKDGTVTHVMSAFNPRGAPGDLLRRPDRDRARPRLPVARPRRHARGPARSAIFNRSHYEDVLVVRVHDLVPKERLVAALRPDQRLRADALRGGHDDRQVLPAHRPGRADGSASRSATTTRRSAGSSTRPTSRNGRAGTSTSRRSRTR